MNTLTTSAQAREQITAAIEQYRRGFATLDVETLKAIWDPNYAAIIYVAQELAQPMHGWTAVEQYYQNIAGILERVKTMTISDLSVDVLGDVAYAFCRFHFEGELKGRPHMAEGWNTFILHRKGEAWKVLHYHESRPGQN